MAEYLVGSRAEMLRWAYRLTRNCDDAQDLLQSTLLCALKSAQMYTDETNLSGWLYAIMRNVFFNMTRREGRCCYMSKDDIESLMSFVESSPDNSTETTLFLNDIRRAVDTLDQPFKIPMALYLSGYKYQEIAEKMGCAKCYEKATAAAMEKVEAIKNDLNL